MDNLVTAPPDDGDDLEHLARQRHTPEDLT